MRASHKSLNMAKHALIHSLLAASILMLGPRRAFASESGKAPNGVGSRFLVLNDCDDDNILKTAPYGDTVYLMDSRGEIIRIVARGLTVKNVCGGLSVSEDGRFFAVCEQSSNKLTVYETATGSKQWSLMGFFSSAVFANGLVYALGGENVFAIDDTGTIVKHVRVGGMDIAADPVHNSLWLVGLNVKRINLDLELQFKMNLTLSVVDTGGFSVVVNPDGSVWIAERNPYDKLGSKNRLVKRSPEGDVLQTIDLEFCPRCVGVDKSNDDVWVTGQIKGPRDFSRIGDEWPETLTELNVLTKTETEHFTHKYDSKGSLLLSLPVSGSSLIVDPFDNSVWITGKGSIAHFSSTGEKLKVSTEIPKGQKWLALVPGK